MAAVCMRMEISRSADPGGRRGGKKMENRLAMERFIEPQLE